MEALYIQPSKEVEEENQGEERMEASYHTDSNTDEEIEEDSEPEPPPVVRRKVSFADAFGLNLVSVKEFDNAEPESGISWTNPKPAIHSSEEFYLLCQFRSPLYSDELKQRLQTQMVELESVELLPGTATIRGIVRVVNLCYSKRIYARMTLDQWRSYFDLAAEYLPGSSDRKTDKFTFRYTLIPPFQKEGFRVEFCLRYETSLGTFWANNKGMNYVLFCHQNEPVQEHNPQADEEKNIYKSKRSCLRVNRSGTPEEKTTETFSTNTVSEEVEAARKVKMMEDTKMKLLLCSKENEPWVESLKRRRRVTDLSHVQDYLSQMKRNLSKGCAYDSDRGQNVSQYVSPPWCDSTDFLYKRQSVRVSRKPPTLTYHQIPLLSLDLDNDTPRRWSGDENKLSGRAKKTLSKASNGNAPSIDDLWENFSKDTAKKERHVSNAWQVFLNGPDWKDRSNLPESEWLQTEVSPLNYKPAQSLSLPRSQGSPQIRVGANTPPTSNTSARQLLSAAGGKSSAVGGLKPPEACVTGLRNDNPEEQRSQTNSVTDAQRIFGLQRPPPVSEDFVDGPECHKHANRERESEGIIGRAEKIGGDEPLILHTADLVTSSGESETTDMTAMPESPNASAVDRISQGARQDEGLSSIGEVEVTGSAHNAGDDMLAFRETIRQEAKDGEMCVEEGIRVNYTAKKLSTGEEIFRPQTAEREISQRYADESRSRLTQNSENLLESNESRGGEKKHALSHTIGFDPNQACGKSLEGKRGADSEPSNTRSVKTEARPNLNGEMSELTHDEEQEAHPPAPTTLTLCSREANLNILDVVEQDSKRGIASKLEVEEDMTTEIVTSTEHQGEALERIERSASARDERVKIGETISEPELSGELESSSCVESKNLSEGAKDPIRGEKIRSFAVIEPRLERFGEDLVRMIWEEVFVQEMLPSRRHMDPSDEIKNRLADTGGDCRLILEKGLSDAFDSGVFSSNLTLCRAPEETFGIGSREISITDSCQSLSSTYFLPELHFDLNSSACVRQTRSTTPTAPSGQPLSESGFLTVQEDCKKIKEGLVIFQEKIDQSEDDAATHKPIHQFSSSEETKEVDLFLRCSALNGQMSRLLLYIFLICGLLVAVSSFDAVTFFVVYILSLCFWIFKWNKEQVKKDKEMMG